MSARKIRVRMEAPVWMKTMGTSAIVVMDIWVWNVKSPLIIVNKIKFNVTMAGFATGCFELE